MASGGVEDPKALRRKGVVDWPYSCGLWVFQGSRGNLLRALRLKRSVWGAKTDVVGASSDSSSVESCHLSAGRDAGPQGANGNMQQQRGKVLNLPMFNFSTALGEEEKIDLVDEMETCRCFRWSEQKHHNEPQPFSCGTSRPRPLLSYDQVSLVNADSRQLSNISCSLNCLQSPPASSFDYQPENATYSCPTPFPMIHSPTVSSLLFPRNGSSARVCSQRLNPKSPFLLSSYTTIGMRSPSPLSTFACATL
ncbi:hypothetical protein BDW62DRAFT_42543 [Aspergillus aurantiobrunneus]